MRCATANVLSCCPGDLRRIVGDGMRCTGRMAVLDRAFFSAGLGVGGVQEGRLSTQQQLRSEHYTIFVSPATKSGQLGVQLWIEHKLAAVMKPTVDVVSPRLIVA